MNELALENYYKGWAHAPLHRYRPGALMITAGTHLKQRLFKDPERLNMLQAALFEQTRKYGWELQAWAIMANHYHFIALAPEENKLKALMQEMHSRTARALNALDGAPGRQVWFQYWDTQLTSTRSYYARFNYVLHNPERHGLVENAIEYRWCSMGWFMNAAEGALKKIVFSFKYDRVNVIDNF